MRTVHKLLPPPCHRCHIDMLLHTPVQAKVQRALELNDPHHLSIPNDKKFSTIKASANCGAQLSEAGLVKRIGFPYKLSMLPISWRSEMSS